MNMNYFIMIKVFFVRTMQVLRDFSVACCAHGGCEATMQSFSQEGPAKECIFGWQCNGKGHITRMHLTNQRMKCTLEAFQNLTQMTDLHELELSDATEVEGVSCSCHCLCCVVLSRQSCVHSHCHRRCQERSRLLVRERVHGRGPLLIHPSLHCIDSLLHASCTCAATAVDCKRGGAVQETSTLSSQPFRAHISSKCWSSATRLSVESCLLAAPLAAPLASFSSL
jgi:hypothetical protein